MAALASIVAIVVALILIWGVSGTVLGVDAETLGLILLVLGAIGAVASFAARSRANRPGGPSDEEDEERMTSFRSRT
jgi:hypothetical protein